MSFKVSYRKSFFRQLVAIAVAVCFTPSVVLAVDITSGNSPYSTTADNTDQHILKTNNDISLTNDFVINFDGNSAVRANSITGVTITNNGTIKNTDSSGNDYAIQAQSGSVTITNSGTIQAPDTYAVDVNKSSSSTITNNVGGIITAGSFAINGADSSTTGTTVTNGGKVYVSSAFSAVNFTAATGVTITNSGEIYRESGATTTSGSAQATIKLGSSSTLINSGEIRNDASQTLSSIHLSGDNNTITLKDEGIVTGVLTADSGTSGNTLQLQHGFGRAYFYETSGDLTLEDLSGNTVVKGSAGSVSLGGQETVDELLGLRTYNLRSALKRYASAPKPSDEDTVWGETFGYYSKRGGTSSLLKYDTHGYGMTFVHPVKKLVKGLSLTPGSLANKISNQLDFVLSVEHSKLDLPEKHDVERTGFLAGFNASNFASFGNWRASGFAVGGMGWYDSEREILTNTRVTGLLDVTANYVTTEVITGGHISHTYQSQSDSSIKNTWDTEIGFTMGYSRTADYNERHYFFWEERNLVQGSIHLGEQLTTVFNDRLRFTLGGELEHRTVLAGRNQTYRINNASVDYRHGSFYENSVAGNLGLNYSFIDHKPGCNVYEEFCGGSLYIQLNSRLSNETRGTYSGGVGVRLNF